MIRAFLIALFACLATAAAQESMLPAEINERDKPYGGHPRQLIDVAARPLATLKPAILIVHGGSWQSGDKLTATAKTKFFLREGFAVAAMNYRLHPEVTPKDQAADVAAAAVWLAKNADRYGIDPRQIYLAGHGSGAHLVSLVGTDPAYLEPHGARPSDLGGILALDAEVYDVPTEIASTTTETTEGRLLRQVFTDNAAFWPLVSPAYRTERAERLPPFFIVHSAARANAYRQAKPFARALRKAGGVAVLYEAIGRDPESVYRFFGTETDPMTRAAIEFIRREANIEIIRKPTARGGVEELPQVPWLFSFSAPEEDDSGRRLTGTQITGITTHEGRLFAGNAYPGETAEARRAQVLRLDGREDRWQLDHQLPRGYTKIAALRSVRFEKDAEGRPIEALDYLLAGATYESQDGEAARAGLFIRTPSGNWTKQDLGTVEGATDGAQVRALISWRDPQTGHDLVFAGASPSPLGIFRGRYDAASVGGLKFDAIPEFVPRGREQVVGFAVCGGRLFAATDRQILRREDGADPAWTVLTDLEDLVAIRPYLEDLDIYWQRNYAISSFRCDESEARTTLAFTTLNRAFVYVPGERLPTVEKDLANLIRTDLGREPHYVMATEATTLRQRGRDLEEWIGIEVYYDPDYLNARPEFPYWDTGFGKDAWYLVRTVIGGQTSYRLEQVTIPGNDPNTRPLARVTDFEKSPFDKDNAVYVGGFAPRFEEATNTAWIARGEL